MWNGRSYTEILLCCDFIKEDSILRIREHHVNYLNAFCKRSQSIRQWSYEVSFFPTIVYCLRLDLYKCSLLEKKATFIFSHSLSLTSTWGKTMTIFRSLVSLVCLSGPFYRELFPSGHRKNSEIIKEIDS